jgi:putative radical SAM enzyme (TIGR03279 family)
VSRPVVVAVAPGSPAAAAGLRPGDTIVAVNGRVPRDVIEWRLWTDEEEVGLDVERAGLAVDVDIAKRAGEPLGAEVSSALFDRVRTCDNHCEFCFIYQLPKGLRRSLYLKDDDYRLSFLYGNFTTLTRFTEADLERVVTEGLSPLHVSIHSTDPVRRAAMLRNPRGATSLRWLRALLDHGVEVRGQIVVCPGVNDGAALDDTLAGILDEYDRVAARTDELVRTLPDLDLSQELPAAPWFPPGARWTARRVFVHIVAETSQHAGHADIIREQIDGRTGE